MAGGIIFAKAGYNAVFEVTLALIGVDVVLRSTVIERKNALKWMPEFVSMSWDTIATREELSEPIDRINKATEVTTVVEVLSDSGYIDAQKEPQIHIHTLESTGPCQPRGRSRLRPPAILTLLSSRRVLFALWASLVEGALFSSLETVLPLQTKAAFGWGSIGGGLVFLPLTVTAFLGPMVGWMCDRYGPRWPTCVGFLLLCPLLTLLRFVERDTLAQKALLCALLTLIGCCFSLVLNPLMAEFAYVVEQKVESEPEQYGSAAKAQAQAFALFNMFSTVGNAVGPLCAGLVGNAAGWGTMGWVLGLLSGVTAVTTGLWCGGWIGKRDARWGPVRTERAGF